MKTYIKLLNKNYDSIILNTNDIIARQTRTYRTLIIENNDWDELVDLTSKREVLFMSEEQFDKYVSNLKCVKIIAKKEITLFTKKGIFQAHKYVYDNGDRLMKDKDYRDIKISGCDFNCSIKLKDSEYSYEELDEFSNKIVEKEGVASVNLHHLQ